MLELCGFKKEGKNVVTIEDVFFKTLPPALSLRERVKGGPECALDQSPLPQGEG